MRLSSGTSSSISGSFSGPTSVIVEKIDTRLNVAEWDVRTPNTTRLMFQIPRPLLHMSASPSGNLLPGRILNQRIVSCLHLRNAGCPSSRTGHLTFTASSRSMHRRPCSVTVCSNLRLDPAARGPLRGRVSGCMGMIGGKSGGHAGLSWRRLEIEHPRASPLHITLCSSTILAVAVPRPTVC